MNDRTHPESVMGPSVRRVQLLVPFGLATVPASTISMAVDRKKYDDTKRIIIVENARRVSRFKGLRHNVETI